MKVGILSIVKNEHRYLDEWIKYHLGIGVDKIYIFEDVGSLSHKDICDKYDSVECNSILSIYSNEEKDIIINAKQNSLDRFGCQIKFFKDCLDYIRDNSDLDWVAYIDTDEFITLESSDIVLSDLVQRYNNYNLVVLQWLNYNANGHITMPSGGVIQNYTTTCKLYTGRMMCKYASCKLLFNLHRWDNNKVLCNMHVPATIDGWCKTDFSTDLNVQVYDKIYIRHYITKSFEEFCNKLFVRGQFCGSKDLNTFFNFNRDISREDPIVKSMMQNIYDKFMSDELKFLPVINNVIK